MIRSLKGRGAVSSPPPRFDRQHGIAIDDGWPAEPPPDSIATLVQPEPARTIISRNDSPDIGFSQSINPYRGCEHGCVYCLAGDTAITMADGSAKPLASLERGDAILGTVRHGHYRRYATTRVLAHWRTVKPAWRVTLADGTQLIASADHRFLTERGWKFVAASGSSRPRLTVNNSLLGFGHSDPCIARKRSIAGAAVKSRADLRVVAIEPLPGARELFDITTGTGDFIANGVVSHNCYARPSHAYMGLSPGLDFETKLFFKAGAAERLAEELSKPRYVPRSIMLGANTDPYQPVEKRLRVTRSILEVLQKYQHPVSIVTKGALIVRDLDLLGALAQRRLTGVMVSLTTLDDDLKRHLEPRAASPAARLAVIRRLHAAGVPVGTLIAPVIPGLTDHELERLLEAAAEAGARCAGYAVLRLPHELGGLFRDWLATHYPERARHVMSRVHSIRGGRDNDPQFGSRMRGSGVDAALLRKRFELATRRLGLDARFGFELDTSLFRPPPADDPQLSLGW